MKTRNYPATKVRNGAPAKERLQRFIRVDTSGCWLWTGCTDGTGYAQMTIDYKSLKAHRVAYEAYVGPIPEGLQLDHLCRVRHCVNPEHLEPVTALENMRRRPRYGHGHETECPYGHPYDEANTYVGPMESHRQCRTCRRARSALYEAMTPEERADRKAAGLPVVDLAAYFAAQEQETAA